MSVVVELWRMIRERKKRNVCTFVGCNREGCEDKEYIDECEKYLKRWMKGSESLRREWEAWRGQIDNVSEEEASSEAESSNRYRRRVRRRQ